MSKKETMYKTQCLDCNNIFYTLKSVSFYHTICPYCKSENINDNIRDEYYISKINNNDYK